jgi:ankyrin repeat protein
MILQCFLTYSGGIKALQILKQQRNEEQRKQYEGIPSSKDVDKNFYYNIKDENGNTFLHLATQSDLADLVRFLIEKGSNVNIQNKEGNTALHIALNNVNNKVSDLQIVDLLMKNGAHIDIVNAANKIPYDMASTEIKKKYGMDKEIMLRKINKRNNAKQQVLTTKKTGNVSI